MINQTCYILLSDGSTNIIDKFWGYV